MANTVHSAASATTERRRFLKSAVAGATGLGVMLAAHRAPAQTRGTVLRVLQWSHFVPAYDVWFDKVIKNEGQVRRPGPGRPGRFVSQAAR